MCHLQSDSSNLLVSFSSYINLGSLQASFKHPLYLHPLLASLTFPGLGHSASITLGPDLPDTMGRWRCLSKSDESVEIGNDGSGFFYLL